MESGQFGSYRIESLIGRGGMGEVYRAWDTEHERTVALKVLSEHLAADRGYRERFRREAHAAARLNEPHVVPIHRYGEIDGRLFLDMRLVQGDDVATVLHREGRMTPERAVSVISQVAQALDAAHADGLVHRDVKPSNVLLTGSGDAEFAYLVDFGIARSTSDSQGPSLTMTGAALGSFDYMAPERFLEQPVDRRVDVYALACVLFECLTGRRPFPREGLAAQMFAHVNTEVDRPSALVPGLPAGLDAVVARGMAKDPAGRPGSAGQLAAQARAALRAGPARTEVVVPQLPPNPVQRPVPQTVGFTDPSGGGGWSGPPPAWTGGGTGPGWGAPPPPAAPSRTSPALVVALVATVVVAVLVVVAVVATRGGGGSDAVATTTAATTTAEATTTASSTTSTPGTTEPTEPTGGNDALLTRLPGDFDPADCEDNDLPGDGADAAVRCSAALSGPVPRSGNFYGYPDTGTLRDAFSGDVDRQGLAEMSSLADCATARGWIDYAGQDGGRAGSVACFVNADGDGVVAWTQEDALAEGFVFISDGETRLAELFEWWNDADRSDFQAG
ncbi:serine/threonine-protein kinase [Klenkia brasiliensis]|uniref:non-specific serine/threonine protein kinase n=1 Tax=Klenkia brasiliensis TaxID=333142 RepID=A0A1G7UR71_9ACTN|nr:serine/threonine-protein kinase [Klenkia brasiliensis]SDG49200.1 serine/threonine protein kinase [Klenkia brasiliensis]